MDMYEKIVDYVIDHQDKFYRLAYSYVRNREDALDVVQDAICKALENYTSIRNEDAIATWFYRIVVNESLSLIQSRKVTPIANEDEVVDSVYIEKGYELKDDLFQKIEVLEEPDRSIIRLRYFEELSLYEIAEILKLNLNTVKSKLYRSLKKLEVVVREEDAV